MSLSEAAARRYARLALAGVVREYPARPADVLESPADVRTPRAVHPAFYGCYDWHSAVHGHWLLVELSTRFPGLPEARAIETALDANLAPANLAAEAAYFARPGAQTFERTYGWAWLLALARALERGGPECARWRAALEPLEQAIVRLWTGFLPRQRYPVRHGVHANTAFGLALALDYARGAGDAGFAALVAARARDWFLADRDYPGHLEPSGADFLSPALTEADLMRRVLPADEFGAWLAAFLPGLAHGEPATLFEPVAVDDRADPQLVHLDGLNLSRAWCLRGIAGALPAGDPRTATLRAAAACHFEAGLAGVESGDYAGEHWLASFAALASIGDS
jgi:hypothetical protein